MRSFAAHAAAILAAVGGTIAAGCSAPTHATPPPTSLQLATPFLNSPWGQIGSALTHVYARRLPSVVADTIQSPGLEQTADAIEWETSDLAIVDAETAYIAYSKGTPDQPTPHANIRAISVLFSTAVQLVVRNDAKISTIADLRGRRVDVGSRGTPVERAARLILESHGLTYKTITPLFGERNSTESLRAGTLDARFFYTPYPQANIGDLTRSRAARLLSIDRQSLAAIQAQHHFLKSVVIPQDTYPNQSAPVLTVGMDVLLLCRRDLRETLVHDLTAALFDSVAQLRAAHEAAAAIDPDRGPATAVPLHSGAVRYYREREILK
jgi:TRAP transporter TAXI family solute receptor